jgi:hypothetical protein
MIREHAFNTRWWGEPVGIVDDGAFFGLPEAERRRLLAPYSWVEYRQRLDSAPPQEAAARAGFVGVDTQIHFRIGLGQVPNLPELDQLEIRSAAQERFEIGPEDMAPFAHERFLLVPGSSPKRVNERYALWCREMIAGQPDTALRICHGGEVQGWFLSTLETGGLRLALAMLGRNARVSGFSVYAQALRAYHAAGARVGFASFSVANTAVHNIYARLGARFLSAEGCWLWRKG